jgi:phosphoribosylformylglycinamidine cyclo-ligase
MLRPRATPPGFIVPARGPLTYAAAGVDIDAGDALVERIKPLAAATRTADVVGDIGGFAGLCRVPPDIEDPVLVSGTDGVGTKLKIAFATGVHDTIGFDLVGMCVNDVITSGARPLFFLDYFATAKLDIGVAESVIAGIAAACRESGCALLGGETAELPGMYASGEYDLAGFAVGVVARKKIIDGRRVSAADAVIALPSSGLHSNGYSLARKALFEATANGVTAAGGALDARPSELGGKSVAEALLQPTRLYVRPVQALLAAGVEVRAMSHITGGGIPGNVPRVLPEGFGLRIETRWARAPIFDLIQRAGGVDELEMRRVFNVGVGFVIVVAAAEADLALDALRRAGHDAFRLGTVVPVEPDRAFEDRVEWPG